MKTTASGETARDWFALCVAHCAGLIDLVAMPLWVGALVAHYRFDPQQAGLLVTLFLAGCVVVSVVLAPRFHQLRSPRAFAAAGFGVAACAFGLLGSTTNWPTMAALHVVAGLAVGTALTMTHGMQARSWNPHRLFAVCATALGVWALLFLATIPHVIEAFGGPVLFRVVAGVMTLGALCSAALFPTFASAPAATAAVPAPAATSEPIPKAVWGGVAGLALMGLVQAMGFSFLERAGHDFGFGQAAIAGVLVTLGLVNLFPAALAGVLQQRLNPRRVLFVGPAAQALMAVLIFVAGTFPFYAAGAAFFVSTILFTHVFAFGVLARMDPSGRILAATPAMMMSGSALGPLIAGTLVKHAGYTGVGICAVAVAAVAIFCFSRLPNGGALPALTTRPA